MFKLYGVIYTYEVDAAGINLRFSDQERRVGLHYLPLIKLLESGADFNLLLDRAEILFWELNRRPQGLRFRAYAAKQLNEVGVSLAEGVDSRFAAALRDEGVTIVDQTMSAYHLVFPRTIDGTFIQISKTTIVVATGFHGTRVSPTLFPPLGGTSYRERNAWAEGFCFQNFTYVPPSMLEVSWVAHLVKKQIFDFSLERTAFLFYPEVNNFMKADLPGDIE